MERVRRPTPAFPWRVWSSTFIHTHVRLSVEVCDLRHRQHICALCQPIRTQETTETSHRRRLSPLTFAYMSAGPSGSKSDPGTGGSVRQKYLEGQNAGRDEALRTGSSLHRRDGGS